MELREAIEEIKKVTVGCDPWTAFDFSDGEYEEVVHVDHAIATILNAVVDGNLIPADAVFQVRDGYWIMAFGPCDQDYDKRVPLSEALEIRSADDVRREALEMTARLALNTNDSRTARTIHDAILALIDTPQPKGGE